MNVCTMSAVGYYVGFRAIAASSGKVVTAALAPFLFGGPSYFGGAAQPGHVNYQAGLCPHIDLPGHFDERASFSASQYQRRLFNQLQVLALAAKVKEDAKSCTTAYPLSSFPLRIWYRDCTPGHSVLQRGSPCPEASCSLVLARCCLRRSF